MLDTYRSGIGIGLLNKSQIQPRITSNFRHHFLEEFAIIPASV